MGEYSEGKAIRNRVLAVYKSGALRSVNSEVDPPNAKKDLALKAKSNHKFKKKNKCKAPSSSSSDDEASDDSNNEDGHEIWSLLFS